MRTALMTGARALVLLGATVLAFFKGGFFDVPRTVAGGVAWVTVALVAVLGLRVFPRTRAAQVAVIGLAAYCAWVGLSLLWAPMAGEAYHDLQRAILYLGVLVAAVALLRERAVARAVEPALAGGALAMVGYGLSERLLPGLVKLDRSVSAGGRLDQPLTYWNAMGFAAALGLVLCARLAGDRTRPPALRVAAAAAAAPLGMGVYVTFSRGALLACGVGLVVLLAACPTWVQLRGAAIALGAGIAGALAATPYGGVTSLAGDLGTREAEGAAALATLAAVCLLAALLAAWAGREERRDYVRAGRLPFSRHAGLAAALAVAIGLGAFVVAAAKEPQGGAGGRPTAGAGRYTSLQSNRYAYWRVAKRAFAAHPLRGVGSSGFRVEWLKHRPFVESVHDAHSLYIETAAELGLVGLALLAAVLGGVATAARRAHRRDAVLSAGAIAGLSMWAVHAGVDWDWEMPAVTIPALVLAAMVLARADAPDERGYVPPAIGRRLRTAARERGAGTVAAAVLDWARRWLGGRLGRRGGGDGGFTFAGRPYEYLHHLHNHTWLNERAIEVPILERLVAEAPPGARVLEVGNVLGYYGTERQRDVIDKYERFPGVLNADVLDFRPEHLYDLIVSVSTLEHVGWDEEPRDPELAPAAVERLRELLAPGGLLVVTVPVGYHPELDLAIREGRVRFDEVAALRHQGSGRWSEVAPNDVWDLAYDRLLYEAGGLLVCTARAPD